MADVFTVAVEGPCCAGKTTLSSALVGLFDDARRVVCYADFVGGGRNLPNPAPQSVTEDGVALERLLSIDQSRFANVRDEDVALAIADRSAHTFLGHRRGVSQMTGLDLYTPAEAIVAGSARVTWPDLVMYLDTPVEEIHRRNTGKFPQDSIFMDPAFNAGFREHFCRLCDGSRDVRFIWLDATASRESVLQTALTTLRDLQPDLPFLS